MIAEVEAHASTSGMTAYSEHFEGGEVFRKNDFAFTIKLARSGKTPPPSIGGERPSHPQILSGRQLRHLRDESHIQLGRNRDVLLTPRQREAMDRMMVCVSRAADADQAICLDL
jgi:hypothetical protein